MNATSEATVVCTDLSFSWPDETPVFTGLTCAVGTGRHGLVGPNGAGKSTLLKLLAGELAAAPGSVAVRGRVGYLPQAQPPADGTVDQALEIAGVRAALHAIEAGDASEEHFAAVGDDWDVEERAAAVLDRLGLGSDVSLDRPLGTLSGGQVVSLRLAAQLLRRPEVLLLDEPTNNLDLAARRRLYRVVEEWKGCLLVVSHDRALLERVDAVAELHPDRLRLYGGNFTAYREAVDREQGAAQRAVRGAEADLRRQRREEREARERAQRRAGTARRNRDSAGLPKILAGARQRKAQESAGRSAGVHQDRVAEARARLEEAAGAVREEARITVSLPQTRVPAGRTVLHCEGVGVRYGAGAGAHAPVEAAAGAAAGGEADAAREVFAPPGIDLTVRGPERIALTGANGSGKSTLLRLASGEQEPTAGEVRRVEGRVAYLSQRLDLLDPEAGVLENLRRYAPHLRDGELRHQLARFLFRGDRARLRASALSGGERLRAVLACVLSADPAPQLLLLDEPTNNLDLAAVEQVESALQAYEGAFVVVSHDRPFLRAIGVTRWLRLSGGALEETGDEEGEEGDDGDA